MELCASTRPLDLNGLHNYLTELVNKKQTQPQRQPPVDFKDRTKNLIKNRTSTYCDLLKTVQVFNSFISSNPPNIQQYKENLAIQLEPIYMKIKEIDTQFSLDDANREHYKCPSFAYTNYRWGNEHWMHFKSDENSPCRNKKHQMMNEGHNESKWSSRIQYSWWHIIHGKLQR